MPAETWSRSDLHRLIHSLHLTHGNFSLLCTLLPSKTPTSLTTRLSQICEHISPEASKWSPTKLANEALRLHGGQAIHLQERQSLTERKNRITVRIIPLSPADSAAVRANGFNPNVEVVLRAHRPLLHVLKHLYDKWNLALVLRRTDSQTVFTDVSQPVFELATGQPVLPLQFSVMRVAVHDKLLYAPSRRSGTKAKSSAASTRRAQRKNQPATAKPAKRKAPAATSPKTASNQPSTTLSTTTCAPLHELNLEPGNTLQGPLPPLPHSIDAPAVPQNPPPLKRRRHCAGTSDKHITQASAGNGFLSVEESDARAPKVGPGGSLDEFPFGPGSPVTERRGKRVFPPLPASLDGFASPAAGISRGFALGSPDGLTGKGRNEQCSQSIDMFGNCFSSPMKDRNGRRVLPPLPFSLGIGNSMSSPITQRDGRGDASGSRGKQKDELSGKNGLDLVVGTMKGLSNPFGSKNERGVTSTPQLDNLDGFVGVFEDLVDTPLGGDKVGTDLCFEDGGFNGVEAGCSSNSCDKDQVSSQESEGEKAVMQRLKGHLSQLSDGETGNEGALEIDEQFGGSFSLQGLLSS